MGKLQHKSLMDTQGNGTEEHAKQTTPRTHNTKATDEQDQKKKAGRMSNGEYEVRETMSTSQITWTQALTKQQCFIVRKHKPPLKHFDSCKQPPRIDSNVTPFRGPKAWEGIVENPGAQARQWAIAIDPTCREHVGSTWKFQMQAGYRILGYLRVCNKETALTLCKHTQLTIRPFLSNHYEEFPTLPMHVQWVDWNDSETWNTYAEKVAYRCEHGLI